MPVIESKFGVSHDVGIDEVSPAADAGAEEFAHLGLADVPSPPRTPPPQIMAQYLTLDTLPSFDSERTLNGSQIERRYGTSVVVGDADTQLKYAAIREEMVKAGPQNQRTLALVEHNLETILIRPYRVSERPALRPETYWLPEDPHVTVSFGVDQGQLAGVGQRLPPVVQAAHELRHGAKFDYHTYVKKTQMGRYTNPAEYEVITGPESEILHYYGEPPRDSHGEGFFYKTKTTEPGDELAAPLAARVSVTEMEAANAIEKRMLASDAEDLKAAAAKLREYQVDMTNPPKPEEVEDVDEITSAAQALGFRDQLFRTLNGQK